MRETIHSVDTWTRGREQNKIATRGRQWLTVPTEIANVLRTQAIVLMHSYLMLRAEQPAAASVSNISNQTSSNAQARKTLLASTDVGRLVAAFSRSAQRAP